VAARDVAADTGRRRPYDATVEELIAHYRAVSGEHPDWAEYQAANTADMRLVLRMRVDRLYGQTR
jgi:hypothetical protein